MPGKEITRITKLFEDLYDGGPWIGPAIMPTLRRLTAKQAAKRVYKNRNTIWEITHHLTCWRENVVQRIQGKVVKTPAHNYFVPVADTSPEAWQAALDRLERSQQAWVAALRHFKSKDFDIVYGEPGHDLTWYENIMGILQHDAYHLGQIVMMAKEA